MGHQCHQVGPPALHQMSQLLLVCALPTHGFSLLNTSLLRRDVQIPINGPILSISLLQPRIGLLEMSAFKLRKHVSKYFHWDMNRNSALTNPLDALKGLGCTLCSTQCLTLSNLATRFPAGSPHARNTTPFVLLLATISITFCVNFSQP